FQGQRRSRTNTLFLEDAMPAFDFAVALRVVRRGPRMRHTANADELLEVPGDELRAVVRDHPRRHAAALLACPQHALSDMGLGDGLTYVPMDQESATTIQQAAKRVEGAGDIDVGDIDMPVLVRSERLHKALALAGGLGRVAAKQAGRLENPVDAG